MARWTVLMFALLVVAACGGPSGPAGSPDPGSSGACDSTGVPVVLAPPVDPDVLWQSNAALAVGDGQVFWAPAVESSASALLAVPLCGGAVTTLAAGADPPLGMAVDSTNVYWTTIGPTTNGVFFVPIGGGTPTTIADEQNLPVAIAVDATSVYWTNAGGTDLGGSVRKAALGGGSPVTLVPPTSGAESLPFEGIAVDSTSVYWESAGGAIQKVALDGGDPEPLVAASDPGDVATFTVVDGMLYWYALGPSGPPSLQAMPVGGGAPTTLASMSTPSGIAADGASVYWADLTCAPPGTAIPPCSWCVLKVSAGGGAPTPIASGLQSHPVAFAVDATSVYWQDADGSVTKVMPK
jgi:hypothetical protein